MSLKAFKKEVARHARERLCIAVGAERFFLRYAEAVFRAGDAGESPNAVEFSADVDPREVFDELMTATLFAGEKIVVIRDADKFLKDKIPERLIEIAGRMTGRLFLSVRELDRRKKIAKTACLVACEPVKDYKLSEFVAELAADMGLKFKGTGPGRIAELIGNDLEQIQSELDKLRTAVGADGIVTREVLDGLISSHPRHKVFKLIDLVLERQTGKAALVLRQIYSEGLQDWRDGSIERNPTAITLIVQNNLLRQLRTLLNYKLLVEERVPSDRMLERLGLRQQDEWRMKRLRAAESLFTSAELRKAYVALVDFEMALKSEAVEPEIELPQLLIRIAAPSERRTGDSARPSTGPGGRKGFLERIDRGF